MADELYPGWLKAFEKQRRLSDERRREQGMEPHPEETWERWKREILEDEMLRMRKSDTRADVGADSLPVER
jgi:hypothetical protein